MKNILPITFANLRKGKSQAVSLFAFIVIAALLLNIGLLLMFNFGSFFENRAKELHAPHYFFLENKQLYTEEQAEYLNNYPGVTETQNESAIGFFTDIYYNSGETPGIVMFGNAESGRSMNGLTISEGKAPANKDDICLPHMFKVGGGYTIGDNFTVTVEGTKYKFKISGFTEEIMCGSPNNQIFQTYLSGGGYDDFLKQVPQHECMVLLARLENSDNSEKLNLDFVKEFFFKTDVPQSNNLFTWSLDYSGVKMSRTMMSDITSIVLVVFAALIVLISLLVMRFRIRNSIEESMTNIGALKAVGYTGSQLLQATILQFIIIAVLGTLSGVALSYTALPFVSRILEAQTALQWQQGFDAVSSVISFVFIILTVLAITWLTARRIKKLHPLMALRQGLSTHSFKKNHFPLNRSRGPLSLLLAAKSAMQAKGQMIMIFIIVAVVSFTAAAGVSIYYNLGLNPEAFGKLLAGEVPDAAFFVNNPENTQKVRDYLDQSSETRKVFYYRDHTVLVDDLTSLTIVAEDYTLLEGELLYEGRYPKHDNELVLSGKLSGLTGKGIGDKVRVTQGGKNAEYLVVGLIQTVNNGGVACSMSMEGVYRIQPDYQPREIYVYLNDNAKTADFVKSVSQRFKTELESATDLSELIEVQLSVYGSIFQVVAAAIVAVTLTMILMTLYLMLKTVILRRRRELGINKALGFTTLQLMNQFALYFMPCVALGIGAGGICGMLGFNSLFLVLVKGMGIMTASMPAPTGMTIAMCAILALVAYAFSMLVAWRVRKISAYTLVSE